MTIRRLMLLLQIGLLTYSLPIDAQTSASCDPWTSTSNTNYAGGTLNSAATTLAACQAACVAQSSCVAIDWNPTGSLNSACWILTSLSGTRFTTSGITHYDLNRSCLAACSSWTPTSNTNYAGGTLNSAATTLQACQAACVAQSSCVAIDWNPTGSLNSACWILTSLSGTRFNTNGITHYDLNRTCSSGSSTISPQATTRLPTSCTSSWTAVFSTNYAGGTLNSAATTLQACQAACVAQSSCIAIDWNPTGSLNSACWILTSLSGTRFTTNGITHYDLTRSCSAAIYKRFYSRAYFVIGIDDLTNKLMKSNDSRDIVLFEQVPCLATTVVDFSASPNDSCVSWRLKDSPDYFIRILWGTLYVQPRSTQLFPDQFALDSSFYVNDGELIRGYSAIHPVAWPSVDNAASFYVTVLQNDDDIVVTSFDNITTTQRRYASFNIYNYTSPSFNNLGDCPNVWTRINNGRPRNISTADFNKGNLNAGECRQLCLLNPYCRSVAIGRDNCYTFVGDTELTGDDFFQYFEIAEPSGLYCSRGCTYTWINRSVTYTNIYASVSNKDFGECRRSCAENFENCEGINWAVNGSTFNCTQYVNNNITSRDALWSNISVTLLELSPAFVACGPCDLITDYILNASDPTAVLLSGISGRDRCRTSCVNTWGCKGFDYDASSRNCYLSFSSYPSLVQSSTRSHQDLIPSACGNGCRGKWDLFKYTNMTDSVLQSDYTTMTQCREACFRNDTCDMFDWNYQEDICYFSTSTSVVSSWGLSDAFYHFKLNQWEYCDDDTL